MSRTNLIFAIKCSFSFSRDAETVAPYNPQATHLLSEPKNDRVYTCHFFIHCESNGISSRLGVHIIANVAYHQPQVAFSFAMMIYNFCEIGDIQNSVLMIYNGTPLIFLLVSTTRRMSFGGLQIASVRFGTPRPSPLQHAGMYFFSPLYKI